MVALGGLVVIVVGVGIGVRVEGVEGPVGVGGLLVAIVII